MNNFEDKYRQYKKERGLDESDRTITFEEEMAYKYRHHEFYAFTTKQTAFVMNVSERQVNLLLQSLKTKAPQLFPVLTKRQAEIRDYICELGLTHIQIARRLLISESTVASMVQVLKEKGIRFNRRIRIKDRLDIHTDDGWFVNETDVENDKIVEKF